MSEEAVVEKRGGRKKSAGPKPQAVQIGGELHAALTRMAAEAAERSGKKVTLRSIVEDAVYAQIPELRDPAALEEQQKRAAAAEEDRQRQMRLDEQLEQQAEGQAVEVLEEADPEADAEVFSMVLDAAYGGGAVAQLYVIGTLGQKIPLEELVGFIKGGGFASDLQGLIEAYENALDQAAAAEEVQQ